MGDVSIPTNEPDQQMNEQPINSSLSVAVLAGLPNLHGPCFMSQLDQNRDEVKQLKATMRSLTQITSVHQSESLNILDLSISIENTDLQLKVSSVEHHVDQTVPASDNTDDRSLYWAWHDPNCSHSSANQSISMSHIDASVYRQHLLSQLAHSRRILDHLMQKKRSVSQHIDALHRYNELKDVGQSAMGKLAEQQGYMTRDMYPKYGLDLED